MLIQAVQIPAEKSKKSPVTSSLHDSVVTTLTPSMHTSNSQALSPTSEVPMSHLPLDVRPFAPLQSLRGSAKPQEQGNTKKKRRSLNGIEIPYPTVQPQEPSPTPDSPELRPSAYGDPMKIAQFFPELN
jgi:glutamine amidotransferase